MIKKIFFTFFLVLVQNVVFGQTVGDYRSVATGNWINPGSWQICTSVSPITWTPATNYPGQIAGAGAVLIQTGHTISISATITTFSFGTLTITGTLNLNGDNSAGGMDFNLTTQSIIVTPSAGFIGFGNKVNLRLPSTAGLQVSTGGLDNANPCTANQIIYIGSNAYAKCTGGGALPDFADLMTSGGTLNANPTLNSPSPICRFNSINLIGNYTGVAGTTTSGGTSGVNYSWSVQAPDASIITVNTKDYNFTANQTGIYTATLNCSTFFGTALFTNSKTISVWVNALPVTPTVGVIIQPTCALATGSVVLSGLPAGNWTINPGGIAGSTTSRTISGLAAGTYNFTVTNASGCTSVASSNVVINAQPATPVQPTLSSVTQPTCAVATGSFTISNYNASYSYAASPSTGVTISGSTITAPVGSYTVIATLGSCSSIASSSVTINAQPATPVQPILSSATQPTCATPTGSFTVTNYNASYSYAVSPSTGVTVSGSTITAPVGSYTVTATFTTCTSVASSSVTINSLVTNTWKGIVLGWDVTTPPTADQKIVFDSTDLYTLNSDIVACSCEAKSDITVKNGHTLTLTNELTVVGLANVVFEDGASLVQINNVTINNNSGDIYYHRATTARATDYTYWSSPVSPMTLGELYSQIGSLFYSYEVTAPGEGWKQEGSGTNMETGIGYIANRSAAIPLPGPPPPPDLLDFTFIGMPNNGHYEINVFANKSYLLGNPYPSALDAETFLNDNAGVLNGTLYFWTHNTQIGIGVSDPGTGVYAYSGNDYATYNATGGVAATQRDIDPSTGLPYLVGGGGSALSSGQVPTGKIGSGQGFFASTKTSLSGSKIVFDNTMRVGVNGITGNNTQFFKKRNSKTEKVIEKNRVWLNLTNTQGAFKQTLVGYVTDATNDYDDRFDGESFDGNEFVDFYSVNQDKNLVIQGRALPFDENDEVPLGYRTTINGAFTINIDQVDGSLTNQVVFIEDKLTNTVTDLKSGNYTFNTVAGTFNDRFVLRYTNTNKTLSTTSLNTLANTVLVSNKNKQIKVNSFAQTIDKVTIYDLLGRQIYQKDQVNSNELSIANLVSSRQTLVVKTVLQNGTIVTDKIIY